MRVMCVRSGNQKESNKVHVGSFYTVVRLVEAWEMMGEKEYYILKEMPPNQVYWTGLLSVLSHTSNDLNINQLIRKKRINQRFVAHLKKEI